MEGRHLTHWLPTAVSSFALAAGLVGVVLSHDWRLLLAVPVGIALTEFLDAFSIDGPPAAMRDGFVVEWLYHWLRRLGPDAAIFVACVLLVESILHFSDTQGMDWLWVRHALFVGTIVMPWGYRVSEGRECFIRGALLACALLMVTIWTFRPGSALPVLVPLAGIAVFEARRFVAIRRGEPSWT